MATAALSGDPTKVLTRTGVMVRPFANRSLSHFADGSLAHERLLAALCKSHDHSPLTLTSPVAVAPTETYGCCDPM